MDGIELQAYGHLMDQFWSPLTNELDGPYGGSLDNRLRFSFDVLKEIRKRVGPGFIVGVRYTGDEMLEGGLAKEDGLEISKRLKDSDLVDFLNVVRGHIDTDAGLTDVIPIQGMANSPHLDFAGEIRAATNFPTFHAAKIPDVATARHAIASGKLDMVGMTRAHMTDPHIVRKIIEKREDDIRPCVGANYCLDRINQGGAAYSIHNAATGRESTMPHEISGADARKKIVIIGAGPAGMEAARVAAERGHEVVVFEAANDPGGQVRLTAQSHRRAEMISIIDGAWRSARSTLQHVGRSRDRPGRKARCRHHRDGRSAPHRGAVRGQRVRRFLLGHHLWRCEAPAPMFSSSMTPAITPACRLPKSSPMPGRRSRS